MLTVPGLLPSGRFCPSIHGLQSFPDPKRLARRLVSRVKSCNAGGQGGWSRKHPVCLLPVGVWVRTTDFSNSWQRRCSGQKYVAVAPPSPPQTKIRNPDTQYMIMVSYVLPMFGLDSPELSAFPLLLSSDYFPFAWGEFPIMPIREGTEVAGSSQGPREPGLPCLWGSALPGPEPTLATRGPPSLYFSRGCAARHGVGFLSPGCVKESPREL